MWRSSLRLELQPFFANAEREARYRKWAEAKGLDEETISRTGKLLVGTYGSEVEEELFDLLTYA